MFYIRTNSTVVQSTFLIKLEIFLWASFILSATKNNGYFLTYSLLGLVIRINLNPVVSDSFLRQNKRNKIKYLTV